MTEDEAKYKWCPYAGATRISRQTETCEASDCMAWRWFDCEIEVKITKDWKIYSPPEGWRYVVTYDNGLSRFERAVSGGEARGYCGLAGKPEVR